ncbi:MAG TPA: 1,2-phenylacetyl-CoA epoxidase subunit PaaC [Caulobacteraceae bacterium]|nr:1,2-phenylacetyl-CoA epoxidase subunit PaaC [Caulobacteraceae bacterium]
MTEREALFTYALRLGDDGLILGQRLSEWCGHAPILEVDLALANIALDLVGQATHFLDYAGQVEGEGRDGDRLAFHRDALDFTNCLLVEQPNGDFARTVARQFLFSTWQALLFEALNGSTDAAIAAVAAKASKEAAYHVRFASEWVVRLGDGTEESRAKMEAGLDWCWRFVDELFQTDAVDAALIPSGIAIDKAALRPAFDAHVARTLGEAGLALPPARRGVLGGRVGRHSEHLGHLLSQMQFLQRAYPGATW